MASFIKEDTFAEIIYSEENVANYESEVALRIEELMYDYLSHFGFVKREFVKVQNNPFFEAAYTSFTKNTANFKLQETNPVQYLTALGRRCFFSGGRLRKYVFKQSRFFDAISACSRLNRWEVETIIKDWADYDWEKPISKHVRFIMGKKNFPQFGEFIDGMGPVALEYEPEIMMNEDLIKEYAKVMFDAGYTAMYDESQ